MSNEIKAVNMRIPEAMHAELVAMAEEDLRSLHAEIIMLLREAMEARRKARRQRVESDVTDKIESPRELEAMYT